MAIGFKPKAEMTLSLPGCSPSEILLVAAEAARQLGWRAGGMTRTEAVFYTPMSMRSWEEKEYLPLSSPTSRTNRARFSSAS